ncbi:3-oxoacyl-ACP synthase, partial [bacterium]|nr:3-oxoacyl-ACP synthase [bacterium]
LKNAGVSMPDAIITGTGLGCVKDTEKFLTLILENNENFLNPTSFIHSTHNTIGSQIALGLNCNRYNQTYAHKAFSFESALLDGMMLLEEKNGEHVLVGGVDEMTDILYTISRRFGNYKRKSVNSANLIISNSKGTMPGEGAAFFVLSGSPGINDYAKISDVLTVYKPDNEDDIERHLSKFLSANNIELDTLDLILMGNNGDNRFDTIYKKLETGLLNGKSIGYYKHLCGEYHTSTSFALWLAANILKKQAVPKEICDNPPKNNVYKNILIYNHHRNENHSFILLEKC